MKALRGLSHLSSEFFMAKNHQLPFLTEISSIDHNIWVSIYVYCFLSWMVRSGEDLARLSTFPEHLNPVSIILPVIYCLSSGPTYTFNSYDSDFYICLLYYWFPPSTWPNFKKSCLLKFLNHGFQRINWCKKITQLLQSQNSRWEVIGLNWLR